MIPEIKTDQSTVWEYFLRVENLNATQCSAFSDVKTRVEIFDPSEEIKKADGERLARLNIRWKGYKGVRALFLLTSEDDASFIIKWIRENGAASNPMDILLGMRAYSDSEHKTFPLYVSSTVADLRCAISINYTLMID